MPVGGEDLLPDGVQRFQLLGKPHAFFKAVIRGHDVVRALDAPAALHVAAQACFLLGRNPATLVVTLALLVALDVGLRQPAKLSCQTLSRAELLDLERRVPAVLIFRT